MTRFRQGLYSPRNPKKYIGDLTKVRYMSSWELRLFQFLDNNEHIIHWASEPFPIPYIKPTDGKVHRYFPDCYVEYKNKYGNVMKEILEVKPKEQTKLRRNATVMESITWAVNVAKWKAAKEWCDTHGVIFRVITQDALFPKGPAQ